MSESRKSIIKITQDIQNLNSKEKNVKLDSSMFFFEVEQPDKIINVKLGLNKNIPIFKRIKFNEDLERIKKTELSLKRQNYGNKWYLSPQKWNESMNKTKTTKQYEFNKNNK